MNENINGLRFIVGSGCNYNCFFCYHEGYTKDSRNNTDEINLNKLHEFSRTNNIKDISIVEC